MYLHKIIRAKEEISGDGTDDSLALFGLKAMASLSFTE